MDTDLSTEKRIVSDLGCEIAASSGNSLVIQYHKPQQRQQLIDSLKPFGWLYPSDDPGDAEALLLEIKHAAGFMNVVTFESSFVGRYILIGSCCIFILVGLFDVINNVLKHNPWHAMLSCVLYGLLTVFVAYSGVQYVTLKVRLAPTDITLTNRLKRIALRVSNIQGCVFEYYTAFGAPLYTISFTMKNGTVYKVPAPFKGFQRLKDELSKRYPFNVR